MATKKKGKGKPDLPFQLGRSGNTWVKGTRKSGPSVFKRLKKGK